MNKTELIAEVANKAGLSRKDAEKALGAVVRDHHGSRRQGRQGAARRLWLL